MRQQRSKVFETNSSSVHSLTIDNGGRRPNEIPLNTDGYLVIHFGSFRCSGRYTRQSDKLAYLATCLWYLTGMPTDLNLMYESHWWELLEDAARAYIPGCNGIRMLDDVRTEDLWESPPYIDHQSVPDDESDLIVDLYDEGAVIDFVWNDYVSLKCSRD